MPPQNRLIHEQSPYLLQHAGNPVDWYPWGEEAFTRAKEENRLIFLSIGYAACHWCHVMEKESFSDPTVAELLNASYIPIKVDREERPEIDRIYMTVCQVMTGTGGWPLSIILTPDKKPVYAATYIPPRSRGTMPGMTDILPYIAEVWAERRDEAETAGNRVMQALNASIAVPRGTGETPDDLEEIRMNAYRILSSQYDRKHGGFGNEPKFPYITQLLFLLGCAATKQNEQAKGMALETLRAMAYGGIRDHIGAGFHRYATDAAWNIPHFEKMLYDQAMNAIGYITAYQVSGDILMKKVALECLRYMAETLLRPEGGFASSEDADSGGVEGAFYLWEESELRTVLGDEFPVFSRVFGITRLPARLGLSGGVITRIRNPDPGITDEKVQEIRNKLSEHRNLRTRPLLDDKVLTDWNGLAIEAFALASLCCDESWTRSSAEMAAEFLLLTMETPDGLLLHRWRNGQAAIEGTAQDYIFASSGLTRLYQATGNPRYLKEALGILDKAIGLFSDPDNGGFFTTRPGDPLVPVRMKDEYDGPVPSVNGHAYLLLTTLAVITGRDDLAEHADRFVSGMMERMRRMPLASLSLLGTTMQADIHAVIVGEPKDPRRDELLRILVSHGPGLILIPVCPSFRDGLLGLIPGVESYIADAPHVRLCTAGACRPPVYHPEELKGILDARTIEPSYNHQGLINK